MKAYKVWTDHHHEGHQDIVFAESVSEAKKLAQSSHVCDGADWIDLRVKREPEIDGMQDYTDKELIYELIKIGWWYDFGVFIVNEDNLDEALERGLVKKRGELE